MQRPSVYVAMLGGIICLMGVLKGCAGLVGADPGMLPGNAWAYFFAGIALFWIGAFFVSRRP